MWEEIEEYLKPEELTKHKIYEVCARNFSIGVWNGQDKILGIRQKFTFVYVDAETHWDLDDTFGTCKPIKEIGEVPDTIRVDDCNNELFDFLTEFIEEYNKD